MIKLKSGKKIEFQNNLDQFFQILLTEIIEEAYANITYLKNKIDPVSESEIKKQNMDDDQLLLKEIMDQSIFVTHQLFDLYSVNKDLAKFLVTGFLFNSIVLSIPNLRKITDTNGSSDDTNYVH